jgi:hypothetical protein
MPSGTERRRETLALSLALAVVLAIVATSPVAAEVEEVEHFDTLAGLVEAADAVVLGQVVGSVPGRTEGCQFTKTTLRVDRVVASKQPLAARLLTVEYGGFCGELPKLGKDIPAQPGVFFLHNKGADLRRWQPGATEAEIAAETPFWRLVILAGSAVTINGVTHVPETLNADFLAAFEGKPFEDLVAAIEAVGAPGGQPAATDAPTQPPPDGAAPAVQRVTLWVDPFGLAQVGVVVLVLGLGGLVAGLVLLRGRRRRT